MECLGFFVLVVKCVPLIECHECSLASVAIRGLCIVSNGKAIQNACENRSQSDEWREMR